MLDPTTPVFLKFAIDVLMRLLQKSDSDPKELQGHVEAKVERHIAEALKWSQRIQFYGMSRGEEVDAITVSLRISLEPRRFRGVTSSETIREQDLLRNERNCILLGDPGAGKTTTLKRLTQALILGAPETEADIYQFPVVLRFRELGADSIFEAIAIAIGIPYTKEDTQLLDKIIVGERWVGKRRLKDFIVDYLNASNAILILDGLDESPLDAKVLNRDLSWMALNTNGSKIILSSRSSDCLGGLEGFDTLEICPLTGDEMRLIAQLWLSDPANFLEKLSESPYHDIADRPLLLTQLLFLYKRYGDLPDQPSEIYSKVIFLMLKEWDAERGIVRQSQYSQLSPDRKADFLAAIAYELTYRERVRQFSAKTLSDIYVKLHKRFRLPSNEVRQVVSEIETHTGIISYAGRDKFEFSHLSLQEYLCANYLVREPHPEHLPYYLETYPAPVAVSIALSSNPSQLFSSLFLRSKTLSAVDLKGLLSRLIIERPFFDVSPYLGTTVMHLYRNFELDNTVVALLHRFTGLSCVLESIASALNYFYPKSVHEVSEDKYVDLHRMRALQGIIGLVTPDIVSVPMVLLKQLDDSGFARGRQVHAESLSLFATKAQPIIPPGAA